MSRVVTAEVQRAPCISAVLVTPYSCRHKVWGKIWSLQDRETISGQGSKKEENEPLAGWEATLLLNGSVLKQFSWFHL